MTLHATKVLYSGSLLKGSQWSNWGIYVSVAKMPEVHPCPLSLDLMESLLTILLICSSQQLFSNSFIFLSFLMWCTVLERIWLLTFRVVWSDRQLQSSNFIGVLTIEALSFFFFFFFWRLLHLSIIKCISQGIYKCIW